MDIGALRSCVPVQEELTSFSHKLLNNRRQLKLTRTYILLISAQK